MSFISDYKSSALALFNQAYAPLPSTSASTTAGTGVLDANLDAEVGQKFQTADGRTVAIVQNGAVALAAGVLVQGPAEVTAFQKLAMTVPTAYPATAGSTQVLVTNGSTVLNINQFAGGFFEVASGTGIGQFLRISSHQPGTNAGTFVVTLEDPIVTTLDATSKVSLVSNPYDGVLINPTTATGTVVGVSLYPLAASTAASFNATTGALSAAGVAQYGFIVTHGLASCLVDSTVTNVGYPLGRSATTAGCVGVATLTTAAQIGIAGQTLTSANNGLVSLYL